MIHARDDYNRIQDPLTPGTSLNTLLLAVVGQAPVVYFSTLGGTDKRGCVFCGAEGPADHTVRLPHADWCAVTVAEGLLASKGNPIPSDEPVFLLRGQDMASAQTVRDWATHYFAVYGPDHPIVKMADEQVRALAAWPKKKAADL